MAEIKLNDTIVSDTSPAYLIAEAGHNHQGSVEIALRMVDEAPCY